MFKDGFVTSIRVNGENLRELNKTVYLPFNSTYEVYLKNTTDKTARVTVYVDDREVIEDLIVHPKSSEVISRFYEGNSDEGHSLKFIKMSKKIEEFRGTTKFDGILQVKWVYSKDKPVKEKEYINVPYPYPVPQPWVNPQPHPPYYPYAPTWTTSTKHITNAVSRDASEYGYAESTTLHTSSEPVMIRTMRSAPASTIGYCSVENKGITVNGAPVTQTFTNVIDKWTWETYEHVIELYMAGKSKQVTTKTKMQCNVCGTKVNIKQGLYCPGCGKYLK